MRSRNQWSAAAAAVALLFALPHLGAGLSGRVGARTLAGPPLAPMFRPDPPSKALVAEFEHKGFKLDPPTGNYLGPKVSSKAKPEILVPVMIDGRYVSDLRGYPVFVRQSIRDRLLVADAAMFKAKQKHISINYGFRSNVLQAELYQKIKGTGKVAEVGRSFHEAGMALDLGNWHDSQRYMIDAGFVGGCYGIEEDMVHYSIDEITKSSNLEAFKRCSLREVPDVVIKGTKKAGSVGKSAFGKLKGK